ncbi:sugar/nucleoside kinase (ribokinase family) [Dongia mobilis]|uniref:Sugar/nucleoside kinase (Ribokinase family) n=1 Tax=Dongia mobilis TaxID=578943 RepID=A0A4R6WLY8_9PROT|nr:adenosine kinase [Dongia mobilis]TDQ81982.1 sugar/nucleoside kinase (ribokinase family) [Dongia mobilis]
MTDKPFDVCGIGNAIVDVLAHCDLDFIDRMQLNKGTMTLIDAARAEELYEAMGSAVEASGGSCGNTIAGLASLGGRGAYIGKVGNDQLGGIFRHDMKALGVHFETATATSATPTARSMIFVTPDAERTMNTYLGACVELTPEDVDPAVISRARVTYLEGYLWDPPLAKQAFLKAANIAHGAGREIALTLSDPFCVERYRAEFQDLVKNHVDILFANEHEITALWQVSDFDEAVRITQRHCGLAAITRSARGSLIATDKKVIQIPVWPVDKVVDVTGAGDLYAAGFLYGYTQGREHADSGRIAALAAGEIISHFGARPQTPLAELLLQQVG